MKRLPAYPATAVDQSGDFIVTDAEDAQRRCGDPLGSIGGRQVTFMQRNDQEQHRTAHGVDGRIRIDGAQPAGLFGRTDVPEEPGKQTGLVKSGYRADAHEEFRPLRVGDDAADEQPNGRGQRFERVGDRGYGVIDLRSDPLEHLVDRCRQDLSFDEKWL